MKWEKVHFVRTEHVRGDRKISECEINCAMKSNIVTDAIRNTVKIVTSMIHV